MFSTWNFVLRTSFNNSRFKEFFIIYIIIVIYNVILFADTSKIW